MNLNAKRLLGMSIAAGSAMGWMGAGSAQAQTNSVWTGASNGMYSTANRWTPLGVPNGNFNAIINAAGTYSVRVDNNYGVRGLSVTVPTVTFEIQPGVIYGVSTAISNNGNIIVNNTATNADTQLGLGGSIPLAGTGFITLNSFGTSGARARIVAADPTYVLTQGPDHTIRGTGTVLSAFNNQGTIHADRAEPMNLDGSTSLLNSQNSGMIKATGAGSLRLDGTLLVQSGTGTVLADNSAVFVRGSRVVNGRINTANGGYVMLENAANAASIGGTQTMNADARVKTGSNVNLRSGTITNNGVITVNDANTTTATGMTLENGVMTLSGTGSVLLNGVATNLASATIASADPAHILTNGATHTIRGCGTITAPFVNSGTVRATGTGGILALEAAALSENSGTLTSDAGATLRISNMQMNQFAGVVLADAGAVKVRGSTLTGGNARQENGGTLDYSSTAQNNPRIVGVHLRGTQDVLPGSTLEMVEFVTNDGTIRVGNGVSTEETFVRQDSQNLQLNGAGTVLLRSAANDPNGAQIESLIQGSVLTNSTDHTIRGAGQINVFNVVNHGTIHADVDGEQLDIYIDNITNHGVMKGTGGGIMSLGFCNITQTGAGEIQAEDDSYVVMPRYISGGTVRATGTGYLYSTKDLDILSDTTFVGEYRILADTNTTTAINIGTPTVVTNQGKWIVADDPSGGNSEVRLTQAGPSFFAGQGAIILEAFGAEPIGKAKLISSVPGAILVNRTNHTIRGRGVIDVDISNEGTLAPGLADVEDGIGEFNCGNVEIDLEPTSRYRVEIAGANRFDRITGNANVIVDGELFVTLVDDFEPSLGQEFRIIRGASCTGTFDVVHLPTLNNSALSWKVNYLPLAVSLSVVCAADFNADGVVDFFDYLDFVAEFSGNTTSADFNADQIVDFFDYLDFVASFSSGC